MSEAASRLPDHAWFDGRIASWEDRKDGVVYLFEVISNPRTFREIVRSPGDPEEVELFEPQPGQELRLTFVDEDGEHLPVDPVVLTMENPSTQLQKGARFIMDARATTAAGHLAYTCICHGVQELG